MLAGMAVIELGQGASVPTRQFLGRERLEQGFRMRQGAKSTQAAWDALRRRRLQGHSDALMGCSTLASTIVSPVWASFIKRIIPSIRSSTKQKLRV